MRCSPWGWSALLLHRWLTGSSFPVPPTSPLFVTSSRLSAFFQSRVTAAERLHSFLLSKVCHSPFASTSGKLLNNIYRKKKVLSFDNNRSCLLTSVGLTPLCLVLAGPRRSLIHLPLPWRQQLLRPNHPRFCHDVAARGGGRRHLLRPPAALSPAPPLSANHTCLVQREAAGLHRRLPFLGLITTFNNKPRVPTRAPMAKVRFVAVRTASRRSPTDGRWKNCLPMSKCFCFFWEHF